VKYSVKIIEPQGFFHTGVFTEVQELIISGLKELRHEVLSLDNYNQEDVRYIILGANLLHLISQSERPIFKKNTVIVNLERSGHDKAFDQNYLKILKDFEVWDFSETNLNRINFKYNLNIKKFLQLGYVKELEKIKRYSEETQDIDVLFIGSLSKRRIKILETMAQLNLNVKHLFGVYGNERDKIISRAKLLLNLHYHEIGSLEQVRIFYYLINSKPILSEKSDDDKENEIYNDAVCLSDYNDLPWKALELLNNNDDLKKFSINGYKFIKQQNFIESLRENLKT